MRAVTIERTLTQEDFDRFAALSGDDNPIHVDPEYSAAARFGRTVAHGVLLNAILRGLLDHLVPRGCQVSQDLMFPAPTYAGEALRFSVEIRHDDGETVTASMTCARIADDTITCDGAATLRRGES